MGLKRTNKIEDSIKRKGYRVWTQQDDDFIKNNVDSLTTKEMSLSLDRTKDSITVRKYRLGLVIKNKNKVSANRKYDHEKVKTEINKLQSLGYTVNQIMKALSIKSIETYYRILGFKSK